MEMIDKSSLSMILHLKFYNKSTKQYKCWPDYGFAVFGYSLEKILIDFEIVWLKQIYIQHVNLTCIIILSKIWKT